MPLYEFTCTDCSEHFEQILSFSMTEAPACPHCRSTATRRLMSMPAIHFKGSGFYKTDSANGKDKETEGKADADVKAEAKDSDGGAGKEDGKGDATAGKQGSESPTSKKTAKTAGKATAKAD